MKHVNLSLVGEDESTDIDPNTMISESTVLSMLDSIVDADSNSVEYVNLPKVWRDENSLVLDEFIEKTTNSWEATGSNVQKHVTIDFVRKQMEKDGSRGSLPKSEYGLISVKIIYQNCTNKCFNYFCTRYIGEHGHYTQWCMNVKTLGAV